MGFFASINHLLWPNWAISKGSEIILTIRHHKQDYFQSTHLSIKPFSIDSDDPGDWVNDKEEVSWQLWILAQNTVAKIWVVSIWFISVYGHNCSHLKTWREGIQKWKLSSGFSKCSQHSWIIHTQDFSSLSNISLSLVNYIIIIQKLMLKLHLSTLKNSLTLLRQILGFTTPALLFTCKAKHTQSYNALNTCWWGLRNVSQVSLLSEHRFVVILIQYIHYNFHGFLSISWTFCHSMRLKLHTDKHNCIIMGYIQQYIYMFYSIMATVGCIQLNYCKKNSCLHMTMKLTDSPPFNVV